MVKRWLSEKYFILWKVFGNREFEAEEAAKVFKENKQLDEERGINVIFAEFKKLDLIETLPHPKDSRKVLYKLKPIIKVSELTKDEVIRILKKAADIIRTRVSYDFILILLFLKRLSDKWQEEYEQTVEMLKKEGLSEEEAREEAKDPAWHEGIDFPQEFLWENLRKETERLPERLSQIMKTLAERNPDLKDIFERVDFMQFASNPESKEILRQLIEVFSEKKFGKVSSDILGDAYEWIISYFAPQKAKEGEVYTPREVIKLMVKILDPKPGESVYDPALGSGGMLIFSYAHLKEKSEEEAKKLFLFGQEVNPLSLAIAKMNLIIHGITDAKLALGDSLLSPRFKEDGELKKFDVVITNVPWNQDAYGEETLKKGEFWNKRFVFGFPPRQSADWAWIQHIIASMKENGRAAIVIDNGCLFRGGKEKAIRAQVLEKDLIEAVILLPEKLFYNTGAPGVIIILRKNKPEKRKGKVLFINASQEYEKHPEVRKLNRLGEKNIEKIVEVYKSFGEV
ncbi:MAG: type I restriction-modification system subunit M, partial [Candidatus Aenigmarchaeota archaeon]|nr:type I restriction-modification system subunit M [Candidatus Aenigmarchaeota archaeon]